MKLVMVTLMLVAQASTPIFRFEADGFWLNLHHFLYVLGRAQNQAPDRQRLAVRNAPIDQAEGVASMSQSDRQVWEDAVRFYANGLSKQGLVFDEALVDVTNAMRVAPDATADALKVDPLLRATLLRAAAIYRTVWWPKHQRENHARVSAATRQLEQHGDKVLAYITSAYQLPWPKDGYQINVSGYANWAGAYSATSGSLIVIASLDPGTPGTLGLELMFHEAMHQWDQPMKARLIRLSKEHQTPPMRDGIMHALIWYTAAEAVKSVVPAHVGYAESFGLWQQQGLGSFRAGLDTYWKPYLDGKSTLDAALVGLLKS